MLLLNTTSSKIQMETSAGSSQVAIHISYVDMDTATGTVTPYASNNTYYDAGLVDILAAPASGVSRNVKTIVFRNPASTQDYTFPLRVILYDGTNSILLWSGYISRLGCVVMDSRGKFTAYSAGGYQVTQSSGDTVYTQAESAQSPNTAESWVMYSSVRLPPGGLRVGSYYRCKFDLQKTAAGTGATVIRVRLGASSNTSGTAIATHTFGAGTAVVDTGTVEVLLNFRTVGASGTCASAVIISHALAATGFTNTGAAGKAIILATGSAINTTDTANTVTLCTTIDGGASYSYTISNLSVEMKL